MQTQTPSTGLRHSSLWRKVPESDAGSVMQTLPRDLPRLQELLYDILPASKGGRCRKAMLGVWCKSCPGICPDCKNCFTTSFPLPKEEGAGKRCWVCGICRIKRFIARDPAGTRGAHCNGNKAALGGKGSVGMNRTWWLLQRQRELGTTAVK